MRYLMALCLWTPLANASPTPAWSVARLHPDSPVVVAHRGASGIAPENTVAAVAKARALNAIAVEFDLHKSADGELVVIHDGTLRRTTNGKGRVSQTPWSELQKLDAGSWFSKDFKGEPIPRLKDVLLAMGSDMVAAIEVKTKANVMAGIKATLEATNTMDRAIIFSFKPHQVRAAGALLPNVPALFLVEPRDGKSEYSATIVSRAKAMGADMLGLNHRAVDPAIVRASHEASLPLFVYTVDEEADVERMVRLGVDGIISNLPRATQSRVNRFDPASKITKDGDEQEGAKE